MKVLIACEESQEVCKAFRALGHEAYSCDTQDPSGGHPEWHIKGDALEAIKGGVIVTMDGKAHEVGKWDLLIAHPPCTYLTAVSAVRLFSRDGKIKDFEREAKGWQARAFFIALYEADIPHIAVENPVPLKHFGLPAYTQKIEPYFFGDPWKKRTCLWLKETPELKPTQIVEPIGSWVSAGGKKKANGAPGGIYTPGFRDQKIRSKTFPGIARAMAEQWGGIVYAH